MIIHDLKQNTPEWDAIRASKPTSSAFSNLITSAGDVSKSMADYAKTLAAEKYKGGPVDAFAGNKYTERGHELEAEAIEDYEFRTGRQVTPVGFITDDLLRWGASTDGLINGDGGIEVKCLMAKHHIGAIEYYQKNGKPPTTYIVQVQGEILVAERDWIDMYFYHPDLPSLIIRQHADDKLQTALKAQLSAVLVERDRYFNILEAM